MKMRDFPELIASSVTILLIALSLPCIFGGPSDHPNRLLFKDVEDSLESVTTDKGNRCGIINFSVCSLPTAKANAEEKEKCKVVKQRVHDESYWSKNEVTIGRQDVINVTNIEIDSTCQVTICEDYDLMGYCANIKAGVNVVAAGFGPLAQSASTSLRCTCANNSANHKITEDDPNFDRNYVGVVYSPYDKHWVPTGENGTLERVSWDSYSENEIGKAIELISTKFTYISTFGMGTASNTSEWNEGDKIGFVPKLAAELNAKLGYPAIRVSVGIFRKDDARLAWSSKELYNAIDASKVANSIFNGTVWGIIATSDYVSDFSKANDAIEMIKQVKEISEREALRLKVGVRLPTCSDFTAKRRPEDDARKPTYKKENTTVYTPLTTFQERLHVIANISDFVLCSFIPGWEYTQYPFPEMIKLLQNKFIQVRNSLKKINPKLKVVFETGVPSQGTGNGLRNSISNFRQYWYSMAKFAREKHIMFHMFEAIDQPWKNIQDSQDGSTRNDINGPNGADGFYGWWKRVNNSEPPVHIEKISVPEAHEEKIDDIKSGKEKEEDWQGSPNLFKIVMLCFFGFIVLTMTVTGYLYAKLRTAKKQIISPAYVSQFHSGGDGAMSKDDNYAVALRIPYNRKYELPKESFHIDKSAVVGSGQCGVVLRGTIKGRPEPIVFKCTAPTSTVVDIKSLMSEIKILSYISEIGDHENILRMMGAYTKKIERGIIYVALEYCPLGSLESFLKKLDSSKLDNYEDADSDSGIDYAVMVNDDSSGGVLNPGYVSTLQISPHSSEASESSDYVLNYCNEIKNDELAVKCVDHKLLKRADSNSVNIHQADTKRLYQWAHQIASAMEFVSTKNVIHADLAARNILLASVDQVKVCDFGLSRKLYQEMGVVHDKDTPLPWRWMAPESLKHLVFSVESDVWSYGITVWEIFSLAEVPYHGCSYDMQFSKQLDRGMRLPQAKYASPVVHEQLLRCWDRVPTDRPSFSKMKHFFHEMFSQTV